MIGTIQKYSLAGGEFGLLVFGDKSILWNAEHDNREGIDGMRASATAFVSAFQDIITAGRVAVDGSATNFLRRVFILGDEANESAYVFQMLDDAQWASVQAMPEFAAFNAARLDFFNKMGWTVEPLKTVAAWPAGVAFDDKGQPTLSLADMSAMWSA